MQRKGMGRIRRPRKRNRSVWPLALLAALAALGYLLFLADRMVSPVIVEYSQYACDELANNAVNQGVAQALLQDRELVQSLYRLQYDEQGNITAVTTDAYQLNLARSFLNEQVHQQLLSMSEEEHRISLGSLSGIYFLAGRGPMLTISLRPQTYVKSEFDCGLESAGVNQTEFYINVIFSVGINTTLDNYFSTNQVSDTVPLVQLLLLGETPQYYAR